MYYCVYYIVVGYIVCYLLDGTLYAHQGQTDKRHIEEENIYCMILRYT